MATHVRKVKLDIKKTHELMRILAGNLLCAKEVKSIPFADRAVEQLTGKQLERFKSRIARRKEDASGNQYVFYSVRRSSYSGCF